MSPPSRGVRLAIDAAIAGWLVAWILIGLQVGREVARLGELNDTVVLAGEAIEQTGDLMEEVGRIPLVGAPVGDLADGIRRTGRSAQRNAAASRQSVDDLSVLLGLSIALIPTIPLAAIWIPLRLRWRRERRAVRRALASGSAEVEGLLADRARGTLPLDQLLRLRDEPGALADAELQRLGLPRLRR
jgi:hypothetical protein